MRKAHALLAVVAIVPALLVGVADRARADAPPASAERLKSAAEEYDRGRRAYLANDFEQAAIHFENAYNDAPRAEALRNAIRARTQAKQLARAATLAAIAQQLYASDSATMDLASTALKEGRAKLHEVKIACNPECGVAADSRVVSLTEAKAFTVFLDPGAHDVVVSWPGDRTKSSHIDAKAGGHDDLTLEAPPVPVAPPPTASTTTTTAPTAAPTQAPIAEPSRKPLGRVPFYVGAGLTAVGIGLTIWSGVDTINNPGTDAVKRDCVGQGESCPTYKKGQDAQLRTNIILASTGGVALVTAAIGLFFTQWSEPKRTGLFDHIQPTADAHGGGAVLIGHF